MIFKRFILNFITVFFSFILLSTIVYSKESVVDSPHYEMNLGLNSNWVSSWDSAVYFSNIARQMGLWQRVDPKSGQPIYISNYRLHRGKLFPENSSDIFRASLSDRKIGLDKGTYVVRWKGKGSLGVTGYAPSPLRWNTSGEFTFNIFKKGSLLAVWFKGERLESLEVIHKKNLSSYEAGNEWNPDYLDFINATGIKIMRTMNWGNVSNTPESFWTERTLTTDISYQQGVPIEVMADFAKRTGVNLWWNIPARATNNYIYEAGKLWDNLLPEKTKLYVEYGNEVWNNAKPWGGETKWIKYPRSERFTATVDPESDSVHMPGHGLKTGDQILCFKSFEDYISAVKFVWHTVNGNGSVITVIDKDNFSLGSPLSGGKTDIPYNQKKLIYIKTAHAHAELNTNFSARNEAAWDQLEKSIDRDRMKYILGSWTLSPAMTKERVDALTDKTRADGVALSFYYGGYVLAARLEYEKQKLVPSVIGGAAHFGLYDDLGNPSNQDVIDGKGAIYSEYFKEFSLNKYTSGVEINDLEVGNKYKAIFVFNTEGGLLTRIEAPYKQVLLPKVKTYFESNSQHLIRERFGIQNQADLVKQHKQVSGGIPIVGYEGGLAFDIGGPKGLDSFYESYALSNESELSTKEYLATLSGAGVTDYNWYKDVSRTVFRIAKYMSNAEDYGPYRQFVRQKGIVHSKGNISLPDKIIIEQLTKPTAFESIHDFRKNISSKNISSSVSFEIIQGNESGIFDLSSDGELFIATPDSSEINWDLPNVYNIILSSFNGESYVFTKVQIKLWNVGKVVYFNKLNNAHIKFTEGGRLFNVGDTIEFDFWWRSKNSESQPFTDSYFIDYEGYDFVLHPSGIMKVRDNFKVTVDGIDIYDGFHFLQTFSADYPHHMVITFLAPSIVNGTSKGAGNKNRIPIKKGPSTSLNFSGTISNLKLTQSGKVTKWSMNSGAHGTVAPQNQELASVGKGSITYVNVLKSDWTN